jgi:hypothetical protein
LQAGENNISSKSIWDEFHRTLVQDNITGRFVKHPSVDVTGMINSV